MKNKPLDFQAATAEHVLEAYKKGQKRVLVADEAGLGKTTVASEVVRRVKEELSKDVLEDDGLYCIVYVCCNLQIAQQNIDTLSDDGAKVDLSQSRLSMQHFVYYRKKAELQEQGKDTLVLSLTPATSFQMTYGTGSANERALMYACLSLLPEFESKEQLDKLSALLVGWAPKAWEWMSVYYSSFGSKNPLLYAVCASWLSNAILRLSAMTCLSIASSLHSSISATMQTTSSIASQMQSMTVISLNPRYVSLNSPPIVS